MARYLSILLFLVTVGQALYLPGLSLWLEWRKDYIAAELCINRFEPELMCSGRCYVQEVTSKALGQQEEDKAPSTASHKEGQSLNLFLPPVAHLQMEGGSMDCAALPAHTVDSCAFLLSADFFHPPRPVILS